MAVFRRCVILIIACLGTGDGATEPFDAKGAAEAIDKAFQDLSKP